MKEAITLAGYDLSIADHLFMEIRELMGDFRSMCTEHVPRTCNLCTHELARLVWSWDPGQHQFWSDPLPELVLNICARDLAEHSSINTRP
jgi:hypothetical protein